MPGDGAWRTRASADHYREHDFADFAQEFLHRNATYRAEFAHTFDPLTDKEGLAERWGLRFPLRPGDGAA